MQAMMSEQEAVTNVAANAKTLLKKKGWSYRELALRIDEPLATVHRALEGSNEQGVGIAAKLAEVFDVTLDDLFGIPKKKSRRAS